MEEFRKEKVGKNRQSILARGYKGENENQEENTIVVNK